MKARMKFQKQGVLRFIGHLDVMRLFQKAMRRSGFPVAFSGGYSPHMQMSFASPLGIGMTSRGEYVDVELAEEIAPDKGIGILNEELPAEIQVTGFVPISGEKKMVAMAVLAAADYAVQVRQGTFPTRVVENLSTFFAQPEIVVQKTTKRSERQVNIRPMIYQWEEREGALFLQLAAGSVENLKPQLVMETLYDFCRESVPEEGFLIERLEMYADVGQAGEPCLVSLQEYTGL